MSVLAVLNVASMQTVTGTTVASVEPSPAPLSLIGSPTVVIFGIITDLPTSKVSFSYLVHQTYNAAGGATGMAQASGNSEWVSIPEVSKDFPNVSVTATATSTVSGAAVTFTISASISYTEIKPGLYKVVTE